jgi:hypothetical protein
MSSALLMAPFVASVMEEKEEETTRRRVRLRRTREDVVDVDIVA